MSGSVRSTSGRGEASSSDSGTAEVDVMANGMSALASDSEEHDDPEGRLAAIVLGAGEPGGRAA